MAINPVTTSSTFNQWRGSTNDVISTLEQLVSNVGKLVDLQEEAASIVAAINSLLETRGSLTDLNIGTEDNTSLVLAINSVFDTLSTKIGNLANLTSPKSNLVVAVNDLAATGGDLTDLDTSSKTSYVAAINELNLRVNGLESSIGTMDQLNTLDKTSLVDAINEVLAQV